MHQYSLTNKLAWKIVERGLNAERVIMEDSFKVLKHILVIRVWLIVS